jgi:hypothetical protein
VVGEVCNFLEHLFVFNDTKKPWLQVHGGGCMAGAFNGIFDYIVINAIGFELPDTVPGLDNRGYNIHSDGFALALIKNVGADLP